MSGDKGEWSFKICTKELFAMEVIIQPFHLQKQDTTPSAGNLLFRRVQFSSAVETKFSTEVGSVESKLQIKML